MEVKLVFKKQLLDLELEKLLYNLNQPEKLQDLLTFQKIHLKMNKLKKRIVPENRLSLKGK